MESGADLTTGRLQLGLTGTGSSTVTVTGAGSSLTQSGTGLIVGNVSAAQARLRLLAGGSMTSTSNGTVFPDGGLYVYNEGERLRLLFTRPLDRTGVTLKVQASSDLVNWDDLAVSVNSAVFTGPGFVSENRSHPLDQPGLVEARDTRSAQGMAALRFLPACGLRAIEVVA